MSEDRIVCSGEIGCGALVKLNLWRRHEEFHHRIDDLENRLAAMEQLVRQRADR